MSGGGAVKQTGGMSSKTAQLSKLSDHTISTVDLEELQQEVKTKSTNLDKLRDSIEQLEQQVDNLNQEADKLRNSVRTKKW